MTGVLAVVGLVAAGALYLAASWVLDVAIRSVLRSVPMPPPGDGYEATRPRERAA